MYKKNYQALGHFNFSSSLAHTILWSIHCNTLLDIWKYLVKKPWTFLWIYERYKEKTLKVGTHPWKLLSNCYHKWLNVSQSALFEMDVFCCYSCVPNMWTGCNKRAGVLKLLNRARFYEVKMATGKSSNVFLLRACSRIRNIRVFNIFEDISVPK